MKLALHKCSGFWFALNLYLCSYVNKRCRINWQHLWSQDGGNKKKKCQPVIRLILYHDIHYCKIVIVHKCKQFINTGRTSSAPSNYGTKTTEQTMFYHRTMWPGDQWPPCFGSVYFRNYIKLFFCSISTSK